MPSTFIGLLVTMFLFTEDFENAFMTSVFLVLLWSIVERFPKLQLTT